jgi:hypothetical protein
MAALVIMLLWKHTQQEGVLPHELIHGLNMMLAVSSDSAV